MKKLVFVIITSFLLMTTQSFVTENPQKRTDGTQSTLDIISSPSDCCCEFYTKIRHDEDGTPYLVLICFNYSYETVVKAQCDYKIHYLHTDSYKKRSQKNYVKPRSEWIVEGTYDLESMDYEPLSVSCTPVN